MIQFITDLLSTLFSPDPMVHTAIFAILGALAGAQKDKNVQDSSVQLGPESALENQMRNFQAQDFSQLQGFLGAGAGEQDFASGAESQRKLAELLQGLAQTGGRPNESQIAQSEQFSQRMFEPQRVALEQSFTDQAQRVAQLSAQLGRPVNDPILQAKLAESQTKQQAQLGAQQGAFAAQESQRQPFQQLDFASQLANVRGGLASQALQNRLTIAGMGQQLLQQERNFRLKQAGRKVEGISGGGFKGLVTGMMAGAQADVGIAKNAVALGSGGT